MPRPSRPPRRAPLAFGLAVALTLVACGGAASTAPSGGPDESAAPSSAPSVEPSPAESAPDASTPGSGDFTPVANKLDELDSYRFTVVIETEKAKSGQSTLTDGTVTMSGTVVNAPEPASSLRMVTTDGAGSVTDDTEIVLIGTDAWVRSGGESEPWQLIPADQAALFTSIIDGFRPERMFTLYFAPIGQDNTTVGDEDVNGVATTHYRAGESVGLILGAVAGVQGSWTADIWVARDGGYLVRSEAGVEGSDATGGGKFSLRVDITDIESPSNVIVPPA